MIVLALHIIGLFLAVAFVELLFFIALAHYRRPR